MLVHDTGSHEEQLLLLKQNSFPSVVFSVCSSRKSSGHCCLQSALSFWSHLGYFSQNVFSKPRMWIHTHVLHAYFNTGREEEKKNLLLRYLPMQKNTPSQECGWIHLLTWSQCVDRRQLGDVRPALPWWDCGGSCGFAQNRLNIYTDWICWLVVLREEKTQPYYISSG